MLRYPVILTEDDNGTVLATCPDLPEAATFGEDREDALLRVIDTIETAIQGGIADREPIPPAAGVCGHRFPLSLGPAEPLGAPPPLADVEFIPMMRRGCAMPASMSQDLLQRIVGAVERAHDPRSHAALCRQPVGGDQADAAGAHDRQPRGAGALWRPASAAARAVPSRPRDSPELSPIEQLFAKARGAAAQGRGPDQRQLWATIGRLL